MMLGKRTNDLSPRRLSALGAALAGLGVVLTVISNLKLGITAFSQGFLLGFALVLLGTSAVFVFRRLQRIKS